MVKEIPYSEFLRDIRQQRGGRAVEKPAVEPWEVCGEALTRDEYDTITRHGRYSLRSPRPVWLSEKGRWTVGAPVNPIEWQILIRSEPANGRKGERVSRSEVRDTIMKISGWFQIHRYAFFGCVSRLQDRRLLRTKGGFRHSRIADKWLFPDLTGPRAGGKWHQTAIHDYISVINREFGCYTYADRGCYPGVVMPDVIAVRPKLVERSTRDDLSRDPVEWDMENSIYAEFKSAVDMRGHPERLEGQLERYGKVPLYLEVEARVSEARAMIEKRGRREVNLLELLREADNNMVCLCGCERPREERSFEPVMDRIREAFRETYDAKARLKKTGMDLEGRERYSLILYDRLGTPKNVGQVIPKFADDVEEFADLFFDRKRLGRITTTDYIYVPERKPTYENKTWKWKKKKTRGFEFRSFSF